MAQIQRLIKGQSDWQEPINSVIDTINNQGVGKPLDVKVIDHAVTFTSGFHEEADQGHPFLKYITLDDGFALVELFVTAWGTWQKGENTIGYIPDGFGPDNPRWSPLALNWDNSNTTYLNLYQNKLTMWANYDNAGDTGAQIGGASFVYITQNKISKLVGEN